MTQRFGIGPASTFLLAAASHCNSAPPAVGGRVSTLAAPSAVGAMAGADSAAEGDDGASADAGFSDSAVHADANGMTSASDAVIVGPSLLVDAGSAAILATGQTLLVKLPSHVGTGYSWALTRGDATVVAFISSKPDQSADGTPGKGGLRVFTFAAKGSGTTRIELALRRPWEDAGAAKTFGFDVVVR